MENCRTDSCHMAHITWLEILLQEVVYFSEVGDNNCWTAIREASHVSACLQKLPNKWKINLITLRQQKTTAVMKLAPWSRVLPQKLTGPQPVKKLLHSMEPKGSLPHSLRAYHLALSWARVIQSLPPHSTSLRFILILPSHLCPGPPFLINYILTLRLLRYADMLMVVCYQSFRATWSLHLQGSPKVQEV